MPTSEVDEPSLSLFSLKKVVHGIVCIANNGLKTSLTAQGRKEMIPFPDWLDSLPHFLSLVKPKSL